LNWIITRKLIPKLDLAFEKSKYIFLLSQTGLFFNFVILNVCGTFPKKIARLLKFTLEKLVVFAPYMLSKT
jgi:hypothetical protein